MSEEYRPRGRIRCAVNGCEQIATQRHHLQYQGPRWWYDDEPAWGRLLICRDHHVVLTNIDHAMAAAGLHVPTSFVTVHFVINPELAIGWARQTLRRAGEDPDKALAEVSSDQLSFADLLGKGGEEWRGWALMNGLEAPPAEEGDEVA